MYASSRINMQNNFFYPDSATSSSDDSHEILHPMPKTWLSAASSFGALPFLFSSSVPATSKKILINRATSIFYIRLPSYLAL